MKRRILAISALVLAASAPAHADQPTGKLTKEERAAFALSADQASYRVTESGHGELDPLFWVSTEPFLEYRYQGDKFWRAMIDKVTGKVVYQIYIKSQNRASLRLSRLTYAIGGQLKSVPLERISFDVSCQRYGCTHYEDFIGEFPREDLEFLAKGADASDTVVRFKAFGDTVEGFDTEAFRNEVAGLLLATDRRIGQFNAPSAPQAIILPPAQQPGTKP